MVNFYLMGRKGYLVLEKILQQFGQDFIGCVVASDDQNVQEDYYNDIKTLCNVNSIAFYHRNDVFAVSGGMRIAIGWKWLLENTAGLIVLHDSLLPAYKGFNPLVTALLQGDTNIGATAIWANKDFDAGDIITTASREIVYPIKIKDAIEVMAACYTDICLYICTEIKAGRSLASIPQQEQSASYSLWRDETDYTIDWNRDADYICRFIDAHGFPYKHAAATVNGNKIRILEATVYPDSTIVNRCGGKVMRIENGVVYVVCGTGILGITSMKDDSTGLPFMPPGVRTRFV